MSTILFQYSDGMLHLSAVDNSGRINTTLENIECDSEFSICYDSKLLIDALKTLPEQPITFEINTESLLTSIRYQNGLFEIIGIPHVGFPENNEIENPINVSIPSKEFLSGISKVVSFAANDELRPIMNALFVDIKNEQTNYVASSGHVLALYEKTHESFGVEESFPLPQKSALILRSLLHSSDEDVNLSIGNDKVRFKFTSYDITFVLLDGKYPNYRSVIPTNNDKKVKIDTSYLKSAISRVMVFSPPVSRLAKFSLSTNELKLSCQDIDFSTAAEESISCEYSDSHINIGFNGDFFKSILSHIEDESTVISLSDPSRASLISPSEQEDSENLTFLLMPMMLGHE